MGESGGLKASDVLALTSRNSGFGGGDWSWIIALLVIAGIFGRGFGGGFGGGSGAGSGSVCATPADVYGAVDQQTLINKLDQQTYGLSTLYTSLSENLNSNFRGLDNAICNLGYQTQTGFNSVSREIEKCCCDNQMATMNLSAGIDKQFCALGNLLQNNTRDIVENANCNTRAILDFLTQDKISTLQSENQSLRLKASQEAQNNYIVNTLTNRLGEKYPEPAYIVPNPNCCYNYNVTGVGYGNNCGCGNY